MTREIKFRAWDKKKKEFIYIHLLKGAIGVNKYMESGDDAEDMQQYTGLKDKNGKEIYEGDIVIDYKGKIYKITFPSMGFGFYMDWYDKSKKVGSRQIIGDYYNSVVHSGPSKSVSPNGSTGDEWEQEHMPEVIGNIYENPELL